MSSAAVFTSERPNDVVTRRSFAAGCDHHRVTALAAAPAPGLLLRLPLYVTEIDGPGATPALHQWASGPPRAATSPRPPATGSDRAPAGGTATGPGLSRLIYSRQTSVPPYGPNYSARNDIGGPAPHGLQAVTNRHY